MTSPRTPFRLTRLLLWGLSLTAAPSISAQAPDPATSLLVPADHWVIGALARRDALVGMEAAVPWGVGSPSRSEVLVALDRAAGADATGPAGPGRGASIPSPRSSCRNPGTSTPPWRRKGCTKRERVFLGLRSYF